MLVQGKDGARRALALYRHIWVFRGGALHGICRRRVIAVCVFRWLSPVTCLTQVMYRGGIPPQGWHCGRGIFPGHAFYALRLRSVRQ